MAALIHKGESLEGKIPIKCVDEILFGALQQHGEAVCVTNATRNMDYTCEYTADICTRFAINLQSMGCQKGDIITMYSVNSEEFIFMVLASLRAGLIVNPINPAATAYELRHYLKVIQPRFIYTEEALTKTLEAAVDVVVQQPTILTKEKTEKYHYIYDGRPAVDNIVALRSEARDPRNDVAVIFFSSGTTGLPKGVMLTHYNLISHMYMRTHVFMDKANSDVCLFPMYHVAGLLGGVFSNICIGRAHVFLEKFDFQRFLECIQQYKPTSIMVPPPVLLQMTKSTILGNYDLSSIKSCSIGAAPTKRETESAFKKRLNITTLFQGYGMTESSGRVLWCRPDDRGGSERGSCGRVRAGVEIKIIDPETSDILGPHTRGELLVKSSLVMKGYFDNPEATRNTVDPDGWLHTGDLAYYDREGYFYIVDRLKELIKYKGNQVAPAELEALLLEHPDVADVGVVGVPHTEAGELPRAFVVKGPNSIISAEALQLYVKEHASHYKQLRGGVVFVDEIPKLPSGKILRHKLRALSKVQSKL